MASLADITANRRKLTFSYLDAEITVTYRPSVLTLEYDQEMDEALGSGQTETALRCFNGGLAKLIESWDFTENEGDKEALPLTHETFMRIPREITLGLYREIQRDAAVGKVVGASADGSSPVVRLANARTGTSR